MPTPSREGWLETVPLFRPQREIDRASLSDWTCLQQHDTLRLIEQDALMETSRRRNVPSESGKVEAGCTLHCRRSLWSSGPNEDLVGAAGR